MSIKYRMLVLCAAAAIAFLARSTSEALAYTCNASSFANCVTVETEKNLYNSSDSPPFVYTSGYSAPYDGGGGVLYVQHGSSCTDNDGSVVRNNSGAGICYYAQTFPQNVEQWGADPTGKNDSTTMIQKEAAAILALPKNTAGVIYFPAGSFTLHHIILPDMLDHGGAGVMCAGRHVTTLTLSQGATDYMFASYNYDQPAPVTEGADPIEITGCTMDFQHQNTSQPGIVIEGTVGSRIQDNMIENSYQAALEITALDINGNCNQGQTSGYHIVQNTFKNSYGPAVKGFDGDCTAAQGANLISDGLIQDNAFNGNGGGFAADMFSPDYQVNIDSSAGWRYRGNGSFGSTGCGDLYMVGVGSTTIANNRFDISDNLPNAACPDGAGSIESILLEMDNFRTFVFSDNNVVDVADPDPGVPWDALKIVNTCQKPCDPCTAQGTVGTNGFAHKTGHFILNAIDYSGDCIDSMPLIAVGNAYNANVAAPFNSYSHNTALSTPAEIVTGTEQYLTMNLNGIQADGSTHYFPVSGFTTSIALTQVQAEQSWGYTGVFAVAPNCGYLGTAPGPGHTYVFQLQVNNTLKSPTCTFDGNSLTPNVGVGSGDPVSVTVSSTVRTTVDWQAVQSMLSSAANPTVNLTFARQ